MKETEVLAKFAAELTLAKVPASTVARSKIVLLDGLSCMLAGIDSPLGKGAARVLGELGGVPQATLLASGARSPVRDAAFANAIALYSVGLNDIHKPSGTHPGGCIIPAVLAMGEHLGSRGADLLSALIAGYEVNGRIGRAVKRGHRARGFHPTGTCGSFGAAAAVGRLLQRNGEDMLNVLGIAGSQASGLYEFHSTGSTTMIYHAGRAAQNGVEANLMVDAGVTGPESVLEGPQGFFAATSEVVDRTEIFDRLGDRYMMDETSLRPHFGCNSTKSTSTALAELTRSGRISASAVDKIEVWLSALPAHDNNIPLPNSLLAARLSVQFNVALVMAEGDVLVRDIEEADLTNINVAQWLDKVVVQPDESLARYACRVAVRLRDGGVVWGSDAGVHGDPNDPLDWDDVVRKFTQMARLPPHSNAISNVAELVHNLEEADTGMLLSALMAARNQCESARQN